MRADGTSFPVELAITRVSDNPPTFAAFLRDISERKLSERELEQRAEQQAAVATLGREALAEADVGQLMEQATAAVAKVLGVEFAKVLELSSNGNELVLRAAAGLPSESVDVSTVPAGTNTQAGYTLATKEPVIVEDLESETRFDGAMSLHGKAAVSGISVVIDGSHGAFGVIAAHSAQSRRFTVDEAHFMLSIANVLAAAIGRQHTDQLEIRLNQAQRLESVGQLAGGIAHDFNNLLSVIINYASFAIDELDEDEPAREDVEEIEKAAKRAAELTRQLLDLQPPRGRRPEVVDVNEIVADTESLLRRTLGEHDRTPHVAVARALAGQDRAGTARAGADQPASTRATRCPAAVELSVETGERRWSTRCRRRPGASCRRAATSGSRSLTPAPGCARGWSAARVRAVLHDQATGRRAPASAWRPSTASSSRPAAASTSTASVGTGTTLQIYLPATDEDAEAPVTEPPREGLMGDGERIMLVEDEDSLRAVAKRVLAGAGYTVVEASGGPEALTLMGTGAERPFDLLLTDLAMPEMSGVQLAAQVRGSYPETRHLYMTGYSDEMVNRTGDLDPASLVLEKPFSASEMLRKVKAALDAEPAGHSARTEEATAHAAD